MTSTHQLWDRREINARFTQERDPFVQAAKRTPVDLRAWAFSLMEKDNRKSHLAPQLSPTTQDLLRSRNSPDNAADDRALETPTSGEIPIVGAIVQSPRDQHNSISNRSPTRSDRGPVTGGSIGAGRPGGPPVHPGLGPRVTSANSIPKTMPPPPPRPGRHTPSPSLGSISGKQNTFALPLRPPPPGMPLPTPPRRQTPQTPDDANGNSRGSRRQATFGPPQQAYGTGSQTK